MKEVCTLKENRDFQRLYKKGKSFVSPLVVTYVLKNKGQSVRCGITTGKKIGNAVRRSRARRVIRAAFRELSPDITTGCDLVFVARGKTPFVKSYDVRRAMESHFKQAGIIGD